MDVNGELNSEANTFSEFDELSNTGKITLWLEIDRLMKAFDFRSVLLKPIEPEIPQNNQGHGHHYCMPPPPPSSHHSHKSSSRFVKDALHQHNNRSGKHQFFTTVNC